MSFLFPFLLGSLAFISIPVLIHLIMRRKPKKLPFPAFRFLIQRQRMRMRRLRLRHLLLLALRIIIIAAIGLALARPQVYFHVFGRQGNRPVAAVLIFDTSLSMDYKTSDGVSRLDEARRHSLELLDQLPEGSRVAILDTADTSVAGQAAWLQAMNQSRQRISGLQLRTSNGPVNPRLDTAFRLLADLAQNKDDPQARQLPRLIFVFSDRTRACWDPSKNASLREAEELVPPHFSGLQQARADLPNVIEMLGELRTMLPVQTGQDYPDQALIDSLAQLKDPLGRIGPEDLPPSADLAKLIYNARRPTRELLDILAQRQDVPSEVQEYRDKLLGALRAMRRSLAGAEGFFVDVGIDQPVDVTLLDLELPTLSNGQPRQLFSEDEHLVIRAKVQAIGKDVSTMLRLEVGKKRIEKALDMKAGQVDKVPFEVDCHELGPGQHSAELRVVTQDLLSANNSRFVTLAVRQARRVLVVGDKRSQAEELLHALKSTGFSADFARTEEELATGDLLRYQAIYLLAAARPSAALWTSLEQYVARGGGVGVVPGGAEMDLNAYNLGPAQNILPGTWHTLIARPGTQTPWNLRQDTIFQHPLLRPFLDWRSDRNIDFILHPREASTYWEVRPRAKEMVLVSYADDQARPALLERQPEAKRDRNGKVLMFTTTLDPRDPAWNNYLEATTSFYPVLVALCTNYLAGDIESVNLNFVCGQEDPVVPLPPSPRYPSYLLKGPNIVDQIRPADDANSLVFRQIEQPGNYTVTGLPTETSKFTAHFSVNLPAEESDLTRVPTAEIEAVLGAGSVLTPDRPISLPAILEGQWSEPSDLMPALLIALLIALALENLLANRFYRRDTSDEGHAKSDVSSGTSP